MPQKLQFELYSLKEYLQKNRGHTEKPHIHTFYQIIWFAKGNGKHFVDFDGYDVCANTFFFISPDQVHCFDDNTKYEGSIIHFNESFIADKENDSEGYLKYNLFNHFERIAAVKANEEEAIRFQRLFQMIADETRHPGNLAHKEFLKHLLKMVLISLKRAGGRNGSNDLSVMNTSHVSFMKFQQLLEAGFRELHTVKEYAARLNVSTKSLANYTNAIAFKTPLAMINERIILEAKRLLSYSALNVNEVGFLLGFDDPSYFAKHFKKHVKLSPGDFRRVAS